MADAILPTGPYMVETGPAVVDESTLVAHSKVYGSALTAQVGWPTLPNDIQTLYESFAVSRELHSELPCVGTRSSNVPDGYEWLTYKEVGKLVDAVATAMILRELKRAECVGICGVNSMEWMVSMQACNRRAAICVPLYDTLGPKAVHEIIVKSRVKVVFVHVKKLEQLADALNNRQANLVHTVVVWGSSSLSDESTEEYCTKIEKSGAKLYMWETFVELGQLNGATVEPTPPCPDDISTIMYTSGTTGVPKGVVLTHRALTTQIAAQLAYFKQCNQTLSTDDVLLSYLPLAHCFGRVLEELFLHVGARIGYWQGDPHKLIEDASALRPTIFCGVPRVYNKIYAKVVQGLQQQTGWRQALFRYAFSSKLNALRKRYQFYEAAPLWDRIIFKTGKALLGGRVRMMASGGAPLLPHVEEFLEVFLCAPLVQGYGMTESCATSFVAIPTDRTHTGTVGAVTPAVEVCLESIPELNYDALDNPPRGEVLLRGPSMFSGYYNDPETTRQRLDKDGWFHTGDIGELDIDIGALRILDRKSNMIKLAQGEFVALERLEEIYALDPAIEQIWVYGCSYESTLVAIVVPNEEDLIHWANQNNISVADYVQLCEEAVVQNHILETLTNIGHKEKLNGYEIVKAVRLVAAPFTPENGLLTPSFKLIRRQLFQTYELVIDAMYSELNHYGTVDF